MQRVAVAVLAAGQAGLEVAGLAAMAGQLPLSAQPTQDQAAEAEVATAS